MSAGHDIFISVDGREVALVEPLVARLKDLKFNPFYYRESLRADATWRSQIDTALRTAKAIIGVFSPKAFLNEDVTGEWYPGSEDGRLIGVRFERYDEKVGTYGYAEWHTYDLSGFGESWNHAGFRKLVELLAEKTERPGVSAFLEICFREDAVALTNWLQKFATDPLAGCAIELFSTIVESSDEWEARPLGALWQARVRHSVQVADYEAWIALASAKKSHLSSAQQPRSKRIATTTEEAKKRIDQLRAWMDVAESDDPAAIEAFCGTKPFPALQDVAQAALASAHRAQEDRRAEEERRQAEAELAWAKAPQDDPAALRRIRDAADTPTLLVPKIDARIEELTRPGRTFRVQVEGIEQHAVPQMRVMEPGELQYADRDRRRTGADKQPSIKVERPFAISLTPVTVAQYKAAVEQSRKDGKQWIAEVLQEVLRMNSPYQIVPMIESIDRQKDEHPVTDVSWVDAQCYCQWLSVQTGRQFRLPSESEWVLSARSGAKTDAPARVHLEANFDGRFSGLSRTGSAFIGETTATCTYPPNEVGLFDMCGNVWEWMQDEWHRDPGNAPSDGTAWKGGRPHADRVLRGGGWESSRETVRAVARRAAPAGYRLSCIGFRVACSL